uniref:Uncharacterized protein n=1 Tax=Anopheles atroparvus TaxID=41427 RepID=A0A182JEB5_ANOAO
MAIEEDVNLLRDSSSPNKERLTVQWLSQSISEIRSELAELQGSFGGGSKDAQFRNQLLEDLSTLRNEFGTAKLELESLRSRQEKTEVLVRELQEEAVQSADDIRRSLNLQHEKPLPEGETVTKHNNGVRLEPRREEQPGRCHSTFR